MKTIRKGKTGEVRRVNDQEAAKLVTESGFHYVPKSVWKQTVRDVKKD